jgi:hypothetical protein
MKKLYIALGVSVLSAVLLSGVNAEADSITVNGSTTTLNHPDTEKYWPGYAFVTNDDDIGNPEILSMDVTWDNVSGFLQKVVINLNTTTTIRFDSLFIDTSYNSTDTNWQDWDYFVHTKSTSASDGIDQGSTTDVVGDIPQSTGLYAVKPSFAAPQGYTTVKTTTSGVRQGHPNGIDADYLTLLNGGFAGTYANKKITYDFSGLGDNSISVKYGFAIGYSPWCANDVILATHVGATPTPEPATMLLFGAGLAGFAGVARIRKNRK